MATSDANSSDAETPVNSTSRSSSDGESSGDSAPVSNESSRTNRQGNGTRANDNAVTSSSSAVQDFVVRFRGHSVITRILIANNGMAAVKAIRSIRRWSYETFGDDRAVQFTVMATPEDLMVNAEYIRMADQFVEVPGGSSNHNYANVDLIVDVAVRTAVHAVWVGWGFASENPALPDKLRTLDPPVVFIGPPASAMRALGDKIASTIVAQSAQVPCIAWSGSGVTDVDHDPESGYVSVPDSAYRAATTLDANEGLAHAERIGFPVMIKASEGGGGKGIRMVQSRDSFASAFEQVSREIPGSPIFIMKLVSDARHLEVQLVADAYGNAIALFGRDCSVQRRHQKIIEEAPVTIAPPDVVAAMERAAVRLAKMVGYVSAGTVEYLYEPTTNEFYFLELNPRLQVEHPTTEMVSGVNIPAAQLQVAMGIPLSCIRDIRTLYGLTTTGVSDIDFDFANPQSNQIQRKPSPKGHVIAARITAENPEAGFKPNSGKVLELNFRSNTNVWGYFSVNASGGVHEFADSQFGHVFSYGETRNDARRNLIIALKELSIRGDFRTTVEFLVKLLETDTYVDNGVTTGWLDVLIARRIETEKPDMILTAICGAVVKAHAALGDARAEYRRAFERGQTPAKTLLATRCDVDFICGGVRFRVQVFLQSATNYVLVANGSSVTVESKVLPDDGLLLSIAGMTHLVYAKEESHATFMTVDGKSCLLEKKNDPAQLRSPSPGKLVRFLVEDGAHVVAGDAYAEIEVMKMYMPLLAAESGLVHFTKPAGSTLANGDVIGRLTLDDPTKVKTAAVFDGQFPALGPPQVYGDKVNQVHRQIVLTFENILDGYEYSGDVPGLIRRMVESLRNPELPIQEALDILSSLAGRIPAKLASCLADELDTTAQRGEELPAEHLANMIADACEGLPVSEQALFDERVAPLEALIAQHRGGLQANEFAAVAHFVERFLEVEDEFNERRYEDVLLALRDRHKNDLERAIAIAGAHAKVGPRSELIMGLLDYVSSNSETGGQVCATVFMPLCARLASLQSRETAKVALRARELLMYFQMPTYEERQKRIRTILGLSVQPEGAEQSPPVFKLDLVPLAQLVIANHSILDVLPSFFYDDHAGIRASSLYAYVLNTNQAYSVTSVRHGISDGLVTLLWEFTVRQQPASSGLPPTPLPSEGRRLESSRSLSSIWDLSATSSAFERRSTRKGLICAVTGTDELEARFLSLVESFEMPPALPKTSLSPAFALHHHHRRAASGPSIINVMSVAVRAGAGAGDLSNDDRALAYFAGVVARWREKMRAHRVRRVTFLVVRRNQFPRYFTFKEHQQYKEDQVIRHIEPAMAYQLELQRLQNFDIRPCFVGNRRLHIYHAVGKNNPADMRFFVRAIVYPGQEMSGARTTHEHLTSEATRTLTDIMDALEIVGQQYPNTDCNHVFINFVPTFEVDPQAVAQSLKDFVDRHSRRLWKNRVTTTEARVVRQTPGGTTQPLRFIVSSKTGFVSRVDLYQEVRDATGVQRLMLLSPPPGSLHLEPVTSPYTLKENIQPKRYKAHLMGTTYVYDYPELFRRALEKIWLKYQDAAAAAVPSNVLKVTELVLNNEGEIDESDREMGLNTSGMVAWKLDMNTPEYPEGRSIIVVANDITLGIGSFGPTEDDVFYKASEYARQLGIPRIYISANSGARIGLAEEVMSRFKVCWVDPSSPTKGFKYLYLDTKGYADLVLASGAPPSVSVEEIEDEGELRYRILDVIGRVHGLGVENLQGSGKIAGETSRAYKDIFTLSLVTCRTVGIGAYLVRLGQRAIQVEYSPIILTGSAALNKVLGREVYTSNLQLGGTQIMHRNGVSHLVASNDMEGVSEILTWLSYVPKCRNAPLPVLPTTDSVGRTVDVPLPTTGPYDPRTLLAGTVDDNGNWLSGFFDRNSFKETLAGWGQGVVVGRARLGGIPVGVISVETRATEQLIAADPASDVSTEQTIMEAGQVWYPNSAYKTAQAISDFNNGEQLPLIVFANWRGFSGGQSDMYKEVLKFGSYIVDALREYRQPVFVYIVGELRGGAWVVLDPTINPTMMEMYSEENARGGVLEPEGIVEIKFRKPQLVAAMERLDATYRDLKKEFHEASSTSSSEKLDAKARFDERERELLPVFHQVAVHFADLHDRPGRMVEKRAVRQVVPWRESRRYFYWRLLRRISEEGLVKRMVSEAAASDAEGSGGLWLSREDAMGRLAQWFEEDLQLESPHGGGGRFGGDSGSGVSGLRSRAGRGVVDPFDSDEEDGAGANGFDFERDDLEVVRWFNLQRAAIEQRIAHVRSARVCSAVERLVRGEQPGTALEAALVAAKSLDARGRRALLDALAVEPASPSHSAP
ncbi:acetyl-coenzyme-A carboxylase [Cladochytrium tenue]|nr:acetyl-coenzyme-A carboxylase [Cladochytrium tenue]